MNNNLGEVINNVALRNLNLNINNLNIIHINAQSIVPGYNSVKLDEIRNTFEDGIFDIIAVSESWLKPCVLDNAVSIEGYYMHRNDRIVRRSGGVCVYIKNEINSKVVHFFNDEVDFEGLFLELTCSGSDPLLLGVIYLPNGKIELCEDVLGDMASRYEQIIFVGDINVNLFENGENMRTQCYSWGLNIIHNSLPTHLDLKYNSLSLIDYFMVTHDDLICAKGQFQFPALNSYHAAIYISYNINLARKSNRTTIRDYSNFNMESFERDIALLDFSPIYFTSDTNFQVTYLTHYLLILYDKHVPRKSIRFKRKLDWMKSREVVVARENRDFSYRAYMETKSQERWRTFCKHRNKLKSTIRRARAKYCQGIFSACGSREMWDELKRVGISNDRGNNLYNIDVEQCNNFFILPSIDNPPPVSYANTTINMGSGFSFRNVSELEVFNSLLKIKSNCIGPDGLSVKFLKLIFPTIVRYLTHIFNTILTTSSYPNIWKSARVVPVPKVRSPRTFSDFRPINVLSVCSKILELLMNEQLSDYLEQERLLSQNQSGFRKRHNTTNLVLNIVDEVRSAVDQNKLASLISLDFSRAFESISHEVLLNKLFLSYGFSISASRLIDTFVRDRCQYVQMQDKVSSIRNVNRGVPQGSVLGPVLFLIYVNDVLDRLSALKGYLYADDLQLVAFSDTSSALGAVIENELQEIERWCEDNFIMLNVSKSKAMLFGFERQILPTFFINNELIDIVPSLKVLGIYVDNDFSFLKHINLLNSRIVSTLRRIHSSCYRLPIKIRKQIAHTLLMPIILYGLEIFSGTSTTNFEKLKKCFNRIIRYVYSLRPRDHVSQYVFEFLGCSFDDFVSVKLLTLFYKTVKFDTPTYLARKFAFGNSTRTHSLQHPGFNSTVMQKSFVIRVIRLWNNVIPYRNRKFSYSVKSFEKLVMDHI